MSFRNVKPVIHGEQNLSCFVKFIDEKCVDCDVNVSLPSSFDYNLGDLIASGQRVSPVDTAILHDSNAVMSVVDSLLVSEDSNDNV